MPTDGCHPLRLGCKYKYFCSYSWIGTLFADGCHPLRLGCKYKYFCSYSWISTLFAVGITPTTTAGFQKVSPLYHHTIPYQRNLPGGRFISEDPLYGGVRRSKLSNLAP